MTPNDTQRELEEISPFLSRLPKSNPYTVPEGYFEQFPQAVLAQARQARVVNMVPRRNTWKLAVAAAVAGALIVGGWLYTEKRSSGDAFASVQQQMREVSDTEMAAFVEGNGLPQADDLSSTAPLSGDDVPLVLAEVSDQELQQYVDQHSPSPSLN